MVCCATSGNLPLIGVGISVTSWLVVASDVVLQKRGRLRVCGFGKLYLDVLIGVSASAGIDCTVAAEFECQCRTRTCRP
jgi:hypothetical protein